MADWGSFLNKSSGSSGRAMRNEDFDEEDLWDVKKERDFSSPITRVSKDSSGSSSAWLIPLPTSPRKIPRATSITHANVVQGSSAPVDIPDWSKIYGMNGQKGALVDDGEGINNKGDCGYGDHYYDDCGDEDEDGDKDKDNMIPPHEWIARKLKRSQISSFSVCEGVGRTLKGRDLSKVRNAILTKTGFIE